MFLMKILIYRIHINLLWKQKLYESHSVSDDAIDAFKQRTRTDLEDLQKGGPSISFNMFPNSFTALINPKPVY